jgi:hypothetical protein
MRVATVMNTTATTRLPAAAIANAMRELPRFPKSASLTQMRQNGSRPYGE